MSVGTVTSTTLKPSVQHARQAAPRDAFTQRTPLTQAARPGRARMQRHRDTINSCKYNLFIELLRSIKMMFFVLFQRGDCLKWYQCSLSPSLSLSLTRSHTCFHMTKLYAFLVHRCLIVFCLFIMFVNTYIPCNRSKYISSSAVLNSLYSVD
jgi:hypothetical protein